MKDQLAALGVQALQMLSPLILVMLGWAIQRLIAYINAKTNSHVTQDIITRIGYAAWVVVNEVGATTVADLKAASGGKLTPEQIAKIRNDALAKIKSYIGVNGLKLAMDTLKLSEADMDKFLSGNIESALARLKNGK